MRRFFALILAALLLCGCAAAPQQGAETTAQTTAAPQTVSWDSLTFTGPRPMHYAETFAIYDEASGYRKITVGTDQTILVVPEGAQVPQGVPADVIVLKQPLEHIYVVSSAAMDYFCKLDEWAILPSLIFMGVGAMTDFGPLLANPKTMLLGAAAQIGVFVALAGAMMLGFNVQQASAIGIIGGADGPTAIYLASKLAPDLLGAIAVAAYSYMSLVPLIQPPIMKMCTTKEQRKIKMVNLRPVSHFEKVVFPIVVAIVVSLLLPPVAALMGCLCMGNLFEVSGVTARLSDTAQNALINIVTIFLATGTGLTMSGDKFLRLETIEIICLGLVAFAAGTAGGVVFGQIMRIASGNKINPLIGSAGVSAVPMAARVSQVVGLKDNPSNYLLMQAMGPNVAGVIGTAVAAGTMLAQFGG
mgnify:CR=1 FL=1